MAYVQGTKVRATATVTNQDDGSPVTPTTLVARVQRPDGVITEQSLVSTSPIVPGAAPGTFYIIIDTSPVDGVWRYQFNDGKTVDKSEFNVRKWIPAP